MESPVAKKLSNVIKNVKKAFKALEKPAKFLVNLKSGWCKHGD